MKKGILIVIAAAGLVMPGSTALGYEPSQYAIPHESHYTPVRQSSMQYRVSQLNKELSQVRWEARARGAGWSVNRRIGQVSSDVNRINWQFRRGAFNPYMLSREIASAQNRLYVIRQILRTTYRGPHFYSSR
ncbi:MAG: hypothetical protein LC627_05800 [Verrucomicrobiaceae bacterium]|nr:hypothetical protein [Verrucomicrobiaceae bacterium]